MVFWPRASTGSAWAQTVENTLNSTRMIRTSYFENGRLGLKEWWSGKKRATLLYKGDGSVLAEMRGDGNRRLNYFDMFSGDDLAKVSPNAHPYAHVGQDYSLRPFGMELPYESIDSLLKQPTLEVVEHRAPQPGSSTVVYHVRLSKPFKREMLIEADSAKGRVVAISDVDGKHRETFEYPDSIPNSVFEPRMQAVTGIETYDIPHVPEEATRRVKQGYGKKGPITLRLVAMDYRGSVWAFWSGPKPDPQLKHPIRLPGLSSGIGFGVKDYTSDYKLVKGVQPCPSLGEFLGGLAVIPKKKVGVTLDLEIPYPGGVARYQNIPVLRIGMLGMIQSVVGRRIVKY